MRKKRIILISVIAIFLVAVTVWLAWGNSALTVTEFTISDDEIPEGFSGFRIAQISDLHDAEFGNENERLVSLLSEAEPDIIVITGDFVDRRRTDIELSLNVAEKAVEIAPTYFVTGNHEASLSDAEYDRLKNGLIAAGVIVLENETVTIEKNGNKITLAGVNDPIFSKNRDSSVIDEETTEDPYIDNRIMDATLSALMSTVSDTEYTVLLSHRPEVFDVYVDHNIDLVIAGHLHGGQVRLPFVGGFYTPNQGFFPEIIDGLYTEDDTNMVVSRGLGNSAFPLRVNNRPEVVIIELETEK